MTVQFVKTGQLAEAAGAYMKRLVCVDIGIVDSEGLPILQRERCVSWLDTRVRKYV